MSIDIDCYENVIGLSRTECTCYDDVESYNESTSGLYLDEAEGLAWINSLLNCENGNDLWQLMDRARSEAITHFIADSNALLQRHNKLRRRVFKGAIGRVKYKSNLSLTTGRYYGVRLMCADVVSGVLKITSLNTLFNTTGTISLKIYNNLNELIGTYTLNTQANTHKKNAVSIELPLHSPYTDNLEYFFVYQYDGTITPKNNDLSCGCGSDVFVFNCHRPYFLKTHTSASSGWANWAMVGSYSGDATDFSDCECNTPAMNYMYGLTIDCEFTCKVNEVLCMDAMDYTGNPLAATMAFAVLYKAAEVLINLMLSSHNLNREILTNVDGMKERKAEYIAKYNEYINYIIKTVDIKTNDCLDCRDIIKIAKTGIFA